MLSLEAWRMHVGYHPLHFWQLAHPTLAPVASPCNDLVYEYAFQQTDAVGRAEIRRAIDDAEALARDQLGYSVGARVMTWTVVVPSSGIVRLPEGLLQAVGAETRTTLGDATVTLSDADGDGLLDTYTATLAGLSTMPAGDVLLVVPDAERTTAARDWELTPHQPAVISDNDDGTYTVMISGPSATIVRPILYEGVRRQAPLDPTQTATYLATLTMVARSFDADAAATDGATTYAVRILDAHAGIVALRPQEADRCVLPPPPTATITAYAGDARGADGDLHPFWQSIIAKLATAQLAGTPCSCKQANHWIEFWQTDVSRVGDTSIMAFRESSMTNPFGVRRGHIDAWMALKPHITSRIITL